MKPILGVALVCGFLASVGLQTVRAGSEDKVLVCHVSQGHPPNEILVAPSAVAAHLAHGDNVGSCVSVAPQPTCDTNPVCYQ